MSAKKFCCACESSCRFARSIFTHICARNAVQRIKANSIFVSSAAQMITLTLSIHFFRNIIFYHFTEWNPSNVFCVWRTCRCVEVPSMTAKVKVNPAYFELNVYLKRRAQQKKIYKFIISHNNKYINLEIQHFHAHSKRNTKWGKNAFKFSSIFLYRRKSEN